MFKIPKHENRIVWILFSFSLVIATSYVIARAIGDSLFLSRVGNEQLSLVFVMSGIGTAVAASVWYFLTRRFSVAATIQYSSLAFAILTFSALMLLPYFHHSFWLLATIYLLADIKGCINAINIVSALNTKLGRDASKSAWAMVGLAAPIAAVLMGSFLAIESSAISVQAWLGMAIGLDVIALALGYQLGRSANVKTLLLSGKADRPSVQSRLLHENRDSDDFRNPIFVKAKSYVASDQFQRWIGILIATKVVVLTIVAFEWKSAVNSYFEGRADSLVRFFGIYYGAVGMATILIQWLVTRRLLVQQNLFLPLLLMPGLLLVVSLLIVLSPAVLAVLVLSTLGKSMDAWRRSVHDTTLNFLYTRIRRGKRRLAISINSGLIKPLAEVAAACFIFFGTTFFYRSLLLVVLMIWILAVVQLVRLVKTAEITQKSDVKQSGTSSSYLIQT